MKESRQLDGYRTLSQEKQGEFFAETRQTSVEALDHIEAIIEIMVQHGLLNEEQAKRRQRHLEGYLAQWVWVEWLLKEHPSNETSKGRVDKMFLVNWLTNHPEFVSEVLRGKWPKWLSSP